MRHGVSQARACVAKGDVLRAERGAPATRRAPIIAPRGHGLAWSHCQRCAGADLRAHGGTAMRRVGRSRASPRELHVRICSRLPLAGAVPAAAARRPAAPGMRSSFVSRDLAKLPKRPSAPRGRAAALAAPLGRRIDAPRQLTRPTAAESEPYCPTPRINPECFFSYSAPTHYRASQNLSPALHAVLRLIQRAAHRAIERHSIDESLALCRLLARMRAAVDDTHSS